jgi:hypothetical protein
MATHSREPTVLLRPSGTSSAVAVVVPLLLIFLVLIALGCADHVPPNTGVEGQVTIGPISPVSRPGEQNSSPYAATISIVRVSDNGVVATIASGSDGTFRVALSPGHYLVRPRQGSPYPIAHDQEVTVVAGHYSRVLVSYDSGIR